MFFLWVQPWALPVIVAECIWNWQLKVDERAGLFQSSSANKIITEQVNYAFIGPHSRGSLWQFPPNNFCLWNAPRSTTCTMVSILLPPFTSNYHATSRSGSISDRRSISPLFPSHQIKRHVPNSVGILHLIKCASLPSGAHNDRRFHRAGSVIVDIHISSNTPYVLIFLASS